MSWQKLSLISIFIVSLSLRLILCCINRQANDDHLEVVSWIIDKHQIPQNEDCWECFQPKAFYLINASIIKAFNLKSPSSRIISVQLLNFVFSFFILLFLWRFIKKQKFSDVLKITVFAFVAFNPGLAAINVQATNDTLVILAGVMAIYFADSFFHTKKTIPGLWMVVFTILAAIVKGSGLVIFVSLLFLFIVKFLCGQGAEVKRVFFILIISSVLIIPFQGGYFQNYLKYDTSFITNMTKDTSYYRPGIISVCDGYFTFKLGSMLSTPYIINGDTVYVSHRTSLWSQLYGHTFFLHFDQHPASWTTKNVPVLYVGRALFILGLFPLFFFLFGYCSSIIRLIKNIPKRWLNQSNEDSLHLVFVTAFFLFIIKYSYDYRDFSTMKSIFIFPALPSFIAILIGGLSKIKSRVLKTVALTVFVLIVLLSIYDISFLVSQLWR
jgi:hypothetical protein